MHACEFADGCAFSEICWAAEPCCGQGVLHGLLGSLGPGVDNVLWGLLGSCDLLWLVLQGVQRQLAQQTSLPAVHDDSTAPGTSGAAPPLDALALDGAGGGQRSAHASATAAGLPAGPDGEGVPGSLVSKRWLQQARPSGLCAQSVCKQTLVARQGMLCSATVLEPLQSRCVCTKIGENESQGR